MGFQLPYRCQETPDTVEGQAKCLAGEGGSCPAPPLAQDGQRGVQQGETIEGLG